MFSGLLLADILGWERMVKTLDRDLEDQGFVHSAAIVLWCAK